MLRIGSDDQSGRNKFGPETGAERTEKGNSVTSSMLENLRSIFHSWDGDDEVVDDPPASLRRGSFIGRCGIRYVHPPISPSSHDGGCGWN